MGRTEIELIVLLKSLVSTGVCYLWLGKSGGAGLLFVIRELPQIEENHEGSHKQLQKLPNPQTISSSECS